MLLSRQQASQGGRRMNYIECPNGRRLYGNKFLLRFGLDWINIFGIALVIIIGIFLIVGSTK